MAPIKKASNSYLNSLGDKSLKYFGKGGKPNQGNCPGNQLKKKVGFKKPK